MKKFLLYTVLNLCTVPVWALAPMEQHVMSASQGMSAFYMHMLSDGGEEYLQQFNRYQRSADASIASMEIEARGEFLNDWKALKHDLKFKSNPGEAVYFSGAIRIEYRNYLTSLYLHYKNNQNSNKGSEINALARIKILSTMLAARALDLVSSDYGFTDITSHQSKFNPAEVASSINQDIQFLMASDSTIIEPRLLRKLDSKFNFIKKNLVDSNSQTAYFLIYRNMLSMSKILKDY